MSDIAIRVEGLGKQYRIGKYERYSALRDTLTDLATAPYRRVRSLLGGGGASQEDQPRTIWALKDVSFEIKRGEVVGIIGRNGAGKSTLLKILSRITEPTEGYAELHGRVGSLLEVGTGFHPELTGRENIYLNGAILGMGRREIERKFDEIVDFSGVETFLDTPLKHYSTGMQMRLAFAVAAHLEPEILLVDEVLAVGDLEFQKRCLGKMEEVSQSGRTVLFVSHHMNQIRRLCSSAIGLDGGVIASIGSTADVIAIYESSLGDLPHTSVRTISGPSTALSAQFLSWHILSPKTDNVHVLITYSPIVLTFLIEVPASIRGGECQLLLCDSDSRIVWSMHEKNLRLEPGIHCLDVEFALFPVRPGSYNWRGSIYDGHRWSESWNSTQKFTISTSLFSQTADDRSGIINIPFDAKFRTMFGTDIPLMYTKNAKP